MAAGVHGPDAHRVAMAIRRFAAGLVSAQAARADRVAASALRGIGAS